MDVDAITLSLSRMARETLAGSVAVRGILLAAIVNNLVKGAIVIVLGGAIMAFRIAIAVTAVALSGVVGLILGGLPSMPF